MATPFSPRSQAWFIVAVSWLGALTVLLVVGVWYYATPKYTRVGYEPTQPIEFSHVQHVEQLGMDCRYCHTHVTESWYSNVPTTQTCMNCHGQQWGNIKATSAKLQPLREAWERNEPIPWVQLHRLPDYAYFNHAVHVNRGVSCVSCHGQVNEMEVVYHAESLSMGWCLDCHREPADSIRPVTEVTNLSWRAAEDARFLELSYDQWVEQKMEAVEINPPESCSGCHR